MTKEELKTLSPVTYRETEAFIHLHCDEGYYITDYDKSQDVKEFNDSDCYFLPLRSDYPDYYVIDQEEHDRLLNAKETAEEEERKAEEEAREKNMKQNGLQ